MGLNQRARANTSATSWTPDSKAKSRTSSQVKKSSFPVYYSDQPEIDGYPFGPLSRTTYLISYNAPDTTSDVATPIKFDIGVVGQKPKKRSGIEYVIDPEWAATNGVVRYRCYIHEIDSDYEGKVAFVAEFTYYSSSSGYDQATTREFRAFVFEEIDNALTMQHFDVGNLSWDTWDYYDYRFTDFFMSGDGKQIAVEYSRDDYAEQTLWLKAYDIDFDIGEQMWMWQLPVHGEMIGSDWYQITDGKVLSMPRENRVLWLNTSPLLIFANDGVLYPFAVGVSSYTGTTLHDVPSDSGTMVMTGAGLSIEHVWSYHSGILPPTNWYTTSDALTNMPNTGESTPLTVEYTGYPTSPWTIDANQNSQVDEYPFFHSSVDSGSYSYWHYTWGNHSYGALPLFATYAPRNSPLDINIVSTPQSDGGFWSPMSGSLVYFGSGSGSYYYCGRIQYIFNNSAANGGTIQLIDPSEEPLVVHDSIDFVPTVNYPYSWINSGEDKVSYFALNALEGNYE